MLFLEGKTLLQCILESLQVIFQKTRSNSTLYWREGEAEKQKMLKFGSVRTILASIVVLDSLKFQKLLELQGKS